MGGENSPFGWLWLNDFPELKHHGNVHIIYRCLGAHAHPAASKRLESEALGMGDCKSIRPEKHGKESDRLTIL